MSVSLASWRVVKSRRSSKAKAVELKGGACKRCGYNRSLAALEFHHRDPREKEIRISSGTHVAWEDLVKELEKCDLLCANCHREVHEEWRAQWLAERLALSAESELRRRRPGTATLSLPCHGCGKKTDVHWQRAARVQRVFCSHKCAGRDKRKAKWPRKERLRAMVWRRPATQIAERLGVSEVAVKKMCRNLGIETPGRGYWAKKRSLLSPAKGPHS